MNIVIATNTNGIDRAFICDTEKEAKKLVHYFLNEGWVNANYYSVDCVMYNTLKITSTI